MRQPDFIPLNFDFIHQQRTKRRYRTFESHGNVFAQAISIIASLCLLGVFPLMFRHNRSPSGKGVGLVGIISGNR